MRPAGLIGQAQATEAEGNVTRSPEVDIACLHQTGAMLAEGPVWLAQEQAVYWLDIQGRTIHRYGLASGRYASWPTPFRIGSIAPRARGGFVGGSEHGFVLMDADLRDFTVVADPEQDLPGNRFNDGKLDPSGRFWAGTMDDAEKERTGSLYRLDQDLAWSRQDTGYAVTNGPTFSPDGLTCYHSDSADQTIFRFDVGREGNLSGKTVFARFGAGDGYPDGMTTDQDGCVWVAFWDGWCLRRLSPRGEVTATIRLPVQRPTSCTFGGADFKRLFVTSAKIGLSEAELAAQPLAGGLLTFETSVGGLATPAFAA